MNVRGLHTLPLVVAALVFAARALPAAPAPATSDEQQVRDAALAVLDASRGFDPKTLDVLVVQSDLERRFAAGMLKAMRAEVRMGHRAAVAVSGSEDNEIVKQMDRASAATGRAVAAAEIAISGDTATVPLAPAGERGTTVTCKKVNGHWRVDLLRRYRERGDITEAGIAKWKARQEAAEEVATIYEGKQERELSQLPRIYEIMAKLRIESATKQPGPPRSTQPNE